MEGQLEKMPWLNEKIKDVPYKKGLYKFMKIFLFRWKGLTYLEMYGILKSLYKTSTKDEKYAQFKAMKEIINIHIYNNNI